jgi:phage terminase large subunit-like protein
MTKKADRFDNIAPHRLGTPKRPSGLPDAQRKAWNLLTAELSAVRNLYEDDGEKILEWLQARADRYHGSGQRREAGRVRAAKLGAWFAARVPPPEVAPEARPEEPVPAPALALEEFLAAVRLERATFSSRLVPGMTCALDLSGPYDWPEDDAATVARDYCQAVLAGSVVSCEVLRLACVRHLNDLEHGHERGLWFDPVAARNIATWYREFCDLKLEPWETWIVTSIFAWKKSSGLRRFSDAWISCAKKQGKTVLSSGIGLFGLIADQEKFADVFSAATKKEQARLIYRDATRAVHSNPALKAYVREFKTGKLVIEDTDSTFMPLSSDTSSMDGLRPSVLLFDEVHEWENRDAWDKLCKGLVSRTQPLTFAITTAGESENCFAYTKTVLGRKILEGVFIDDTTFVAIYEIDKEDDFHDETCWPKANPNLGVSIQPNALRKILAEVAQDPSGQTAFLRYHCNRWVSWRAGRSIPVAKWDRCRGMDLPNTSPLELRRIFLEEHADKNCWGGFDYGEMSDLAAYVLLFKTPEAVTCVPYFWMPEHGLIDKEKAWGVPLQTWARAGWIKLIEGDMTDPRIVRDDILNLCAEGPGRVRSIGYDPWKARVMMAEIAEKNVCEVIAVPQKPSELTIPCREFKQAVWEQKFWHLGNPILRWMGGNVVLESDDSTGGMRPKKLSTNEKIDGIQALITAWHRLLAAPKTLDWDGIIKFI